MTENFTDSAETEAKETIEAVIDELKDGIELTEEEMKLAESVNDSDDDDDDESDALENIDIVTLTDEDGNDYEFELLDYMDYKEKLYAILIPADLPEEDDGEQVVIMEVVFDNNVPDFIFVENEKLAEEILDAYSKRPEDE